MPIYTSELKNNTLVHQTGTGSTMGSGFTFTVENDRNGWSARSANGGFVLGNTGVAIPTGTGAYFIRLSNETLKLNSGNEISSGSIVTVTFWAIAPGTNYTTGNGFSAGAEESPDTNEGIKLEFHDDTDFGSGTDVVAALFQRSTTNLNDGSFSNLSSNGFIQVNGAELPEYSGTPPDTNVALHAYRITFTVPGSGAGFYRLRRQGAAGAIDDVFIYDLKVQIVGGGHSEGILSATDDVILHIDSDSGSVNSTSKVVVKAGSAGTEVAEINESGDLQIDGDLTVSGGEVNGVTIATNSLTLGNGATIVNTDANLLTIAERKVIFTSATMSHPVVELTNTANDATGPNLRLVNDRGSNAGVANDVAGRIDFFAKDAAQDWIETSEIVSRIKSVTNGEEGGSLTISVAEHDGGLTAGLVIEDGDQNGELDVTIGAGAASLTTVTGALTVSGGAITGNGSGITTLNASNISSGTINSARLPATIAADTTGTADQANDVYISNDDDDDATRYITFVDNSTSGYKRLSEDDALTYNPANNVLTAVTFSGALSGNATTATTLATARTIDITGDITATAVAFDGSADIAISAQVNNNSHTHTSANISDATSANTANMIVERDGSGNFSAGTITADLSGTATQINCTTVNDNDTCYVVFVEGSGNRAPQVDGDLNYNPQNMQLNVNGLVYSNFVVRDNQDEGIRGVKGSGSNAAGGNLRVMGGPSTGTGDGGYIYFQTTDGGSSGSSLNSYTTHMTIADNGKINVGKSAASNIGKGDFVVRQANDPNFNGGDILANDDGFVIADAEGTEHYRFVIGQNGNLWVGGGDHTLANSTNQSDAQGMIIKNRDSFTTMNFTGQHRCKTAEISDDWENLEGMIVVASGDYSNTDKLIRNKITINESQPVVSLARERNDKRVFGVYSGEEDLLGGSTRTYNAGGLFTAVIEEADEDDRDRYYINSLGEGGIWVSNINGNFENGDYITTCEIPGIGMKQDDDLFHNYTVGKITMNCDFDLNSTKYKCVEVHREGQTYKKAFVGCTYHCG